MIGCEYSPPSGTQPAAILVLAPGSGGGLGPGLSIHPQTFSNIRKNTAHGGLYMRLGMEAAHGTEVDWSYRPTWWAAAPHGRCLEGEQIEQNQSPAVATLQFNYSTCPKGQLRHVTVLESAVQDMLAAVRWMKAKYPRLRG